MVRIAAFPRVKPYLEPTKVIKKLPKKCRWLFTSRVKQWIVKPSAYGLVHITEAKMEIQVTSFDITTGITTTRTEYVVLDVPASVMIKAGA